MKVWVAIGVLFFSLITVTHLKAEEGAPTTVPPTLDLTTEKAIAEVLKDLKEEGKATEIVPELNILVPFKVPIDPEQPPTVNLIFYSLPNVDLQHPGAVAFQAIDNEQIVAVKGYSTSKLKETKGFGPLLREYSSSIVVIYFNTPEVNVPQNPSKAEFNTLLEVAVEEKCPIFFGELKDLPPINVILAPIKTKEGNEEKEPENIITSKSFIAT